MPPTSKDRYDPEYIDRENCYWDDEKEEWVCYTYFTYYTTGGGGGRVSASGKKGKKLYPTTGVTMRLPSVGKGKSSFQFETIDYIFKKARDGPGCVMIQDIEYEESDVYLPIIAVNDKRVIYKFGKSFGKFTVKCVAYVMNCKAKLYVKLNRLQEAFEKVRIASKDKPLNISACGLKCKVYYTHMNLGRVDPRHNSIEFTLTCLVAPKSNK